ncbi:leucine-rich repeat domain-containing protein [Homoserinimonas sp. A447]
MPTTRDSHLHAHVARAARAAVVLLAGLLVAVATVLTAPPAFAATVTEGGMTFVTDDAARTATVTDFDDSVTVLVIPDTITHAGSDYVVTAIGDRAFIYAPLTSVTIPDSVSTIGGNAFSYTALTSVTIGSSVTTIGHHSFFDTYLNSVTIPDSVTTIGDFAFSGTALTTATIGNSVTTIGRYAFANARFASIVIPDSVTSVGDFAFSNTSLTSVSIPDSITTIGDFAFSGTSLTTVTIPNSITTIGHYVFSNTSLTTVTIPNSITSIGDGAFSSTPLTTVTIPNSVTTIGYRAFAGTRLTTVTIPGSVTSIGAEAFYLSSLTSPVFQGAPPSTLTANGVNGSLGTNPALVVYYPSRFAAGYAPGGAITWQGYTTAPGATLGFDTGGHGDPIDSVTIVPATTAAPPTAPTRIGYTFTGWFTTSTGATPFDFTAPLAADATAFAGWVALPASPTTPAATLPPTGADFTPVVLAGTLLLLLGTLLMVGRRAIAPRNESE